LRIVQKDDTALLRGARGERFIILVTGGQERTKEAVIDTSRLIGLEFGSEFDLGGEKFAVLEPSTADLMAAAPRKTQVILPKDAGRIIIAASIRAGDTVVEAGAGSGALTVALSRAVGAHGKVIALDVKEEHLDVARKTVRRAASRNVELRLGDVRSDVTEKGVDAFVLDLPEPWDVLGAAKQALRPGGHIVCYVPSFNQVETTVRALRAQGSGFDDVTAFEVLERQVDVGERSARPATEMLGHTGFIIAGRRV
jgi:tRNA (adenine57-N1/adenine58-N1)-methyltransferase